MDVYLSARNVRKTYGAAVALRDVSFELYEGEIFALLGPNGAGKTTLIKILATLLNKDGGKVTILGYDLDKDIEQIRHLFGYVGQDTDRSAYARLTVLENLRFFGALRGLKRSDLDQQVDKLASYFDFHSQLDKLFMHLSGGQKQTAVIMRALIYDPPVIYLDEPTKGLDPVVGRKIRSFLQQYVHKERKSLLLTSHILSEVDELAQRVAMIHDGTIAVAGTPAELKAVLGAQHLIELETKALSAAAHADLAALPQVTIQPERDPGWVALGITKPLEGTAAVIDVLRTHGIDVPLRYRTVSLEDAFIHHIGVLNERFEA